jgi:hypothetical protein
VTKSRLLQTHELTEPGWYWHRDHQDLEWWPEKIERYQGRLRRLSGRVLVNEVNPKLTIRGEWVGPLEPPE